LDCIHTQTHNRQKASLEFTRGFHVHFDQVSRILSLVTQSHGRGRFYRAELAEATGLSEIQAGVQAKIAAAMGLLAPISYRLTNFGRLVSDYDLFFEDLGTLWVCHYALSSEPKRLLWNHVINCLLPTGHLYSAPDVRETLGFLAETHSTLHAYCNARCSKRLAVFSTLTPNKPSASFTISARRMRAIMP